MFKGIIKAGIAWAEARIFWIKMAAWAIGVAAVFYSGIQTQYTVERARETRKLHEQQVATDRAQRQLAAEAAVTQNALADLMTQNRDLKERLHADLKINSQYRACRLAPSTVELLNK